jgi:hypothetical protein
MGEDKIGHDFARQIMRYIANSVDRPGVSQSCPRQYVNGSAKRSQFIFEAAVMAQDKMMLKLSLALPFESSERREEGLDSTVEISVCEMENPHAVRTALMGETSPRARS